MRAALAVLATGDLLQAIGHRSLILDCQDLIGFWQLRSPRWLAAFKEELLHEIPYFTKH